MPAIQQIAQYENAIKQIQCDETNDVCQQQLWTPKPINIQGMRRFNNICLLILILFSELCTKQLTAL